MKKITKSLAILALITIGVIGFYWGRNVKQSDINVKLLKQIYSKGEKARVTISNNDAQQICFSTCYPYRLQKKNGDWGSYKYPDCPEENLNLPCVAPNEKRSFEFTLEERINNGIHRVAIPINRGGEEGEKFKEDKQVYSKPFDVK